MIAAQYTQSRVNRLSRTRRLHFLLAGAALARAVTTQAVGVYFQNSYGLVSPSNTVTFSEFSPPPNTMITTQYQAFGVTFAPWVHYASIYNQNSGTPHIDPTACVANFVQFHPPVPTFSIVFGRPVSAAAFAVLSQPGTFQVTALMVGSELPGGPHTFTGGYGPDRTTNFVGYTDVLFDELRISNIATSDGALVLDNLQFTPALVNSWTNPVSARWDSSTNWSLRTLPASNQTVNIANAGFKAVNVDGATFANFPGSVTVSNLFLAAPTAGLSTLLLNFTGLNAPFKVLNGCSIGSNGRLQNLYSLFEMDGVAGGTLDIYGGGTFVQEGGQTAASVPVHIFNGLIALTNGNMTLGPLSLGVPGSPDAGTMIHNGGSVAAESVLINHGTYNLYQGTLYAINGSTVANSSSSAFHQAGGTNYGNISVNDGATYTQDSGLCQGDVFSVSGLSQFQQNGGLSKMQFLDVTGTGDIFQVAIGFYLRQGEVQCGKLNIGGEGQVQQDGGHLILTNNFDLHGNLFIVGDHGPVIEHAYFRLVNGTLSLPSMRLGPYAGFNQLGGTNDISGGLDIINNTYYLPGGVLQTTYTGVGVQASVLQFRGSHYVNGVLSLSGTYDLQGGPLHVNGLYLRGTLNISDTYQPADFINSGLVDLGGIVHAATGASLGQVRLSTNALFDLSSGRAQVRCQDSSGVEWTPGAFLFVSNWHATAGADSATNAVYFGTSAAGLTASQLAQVRFINPGEMAPGVYAAQICSSGEIVPAPRPTLQAAHTGSALVLTWSGNYELLSATNINGPYTPVPGASSPWTNLFSKPQEFFKLQGL